MGEIPYGQQYGEIQNDIELEKFAQYIHVYESDKQTAEKFIAQGQPIMYIFDSMLLSQSTQLRLQHGDTNSNNNKLDRKNSFVDNNLINRNYIKLLKEFNDDIKLPKYFNNFLTKSNMV